MRDRAKICLAVLLFCAMFGFALFSLIHLALYGEIRAYGRWAHFSEAPVRFVIGTAASIFTLIIGIVCAGFAFYAIPKERAARKRWENRPRFDDESRHIYVKPVDTKRD